MGESITKDLLIRILIDEQVLTINKCFTGPDSNKGVNLGLKKKIHLFRH